ncbi:UNVERIFIED_CONTAM: hypothetical protein GTU68_008784 [Idotea baltica]|nr:hypothetical protein [Idotea baltica]
MVEANHLNVLNAVMSVLQNGN